MCVLPGRVRVREGLPLLIFEHRLQGGGIGVCRNDFWRVALGLQDYDALVRVERQN